MFSPLYNWRHQPMTIDNRALKLFFAKDEKVVSCVYHSYSRLIYLLSFDILKNREESEEVVQEAFIKVLEKGKEASIEPKTFLAYLCTTAKNLSYDRYKSTSRYEELDDKEAISVDEYAGNDLFDKLKTILNENEYEALSLRLYADLSFKEVGQVMGVTSSAARGYCHRALSKAKKNLKKEEWL